MIYQGQKIMAKRWKRFPAPLPTLLLHGTDDPISSYQATSALSTLLLKLQPTNFVFKSWKGNKHDPHWDIDAVSVRSEYIHWIWNNSRHFVRLPLEPDVNKSAKSKASNMANKKDKKDKKAGKKADKADQNRSQGQEPSNGATHIEPAASSSSKDSSTQPVTLSGAEPEVIQDLAQLRRQQELRVQRAMEKRQEYNLSETGQEPVSTIAICPSKGPAPTDAAIASTLSVSDPHKMSETKQRAEPAGLNIPIFNIAGRSQEVLAEAVLSDSNDIPAASSIVLTETQSVDSIIIPKLENNSAEVETGNGAALPESNESTIKESAKKIGINLTTKSIGTMPAIAI
ncbi:hypothetical protein BGZ50_000284 [Haplosporangium sp. Z 11]|nr:hypothetical protein BGZ50_000284 [Haplosporangium sp. Z 11]